MAGVGFGQVVSWYVCTIVAWIFLVARVYLRFRKLGKLGLDDALIILSACCLIGDLAIQQHMWNLGMAEIPTASRENFIEIMKMIVPGSILYVSSLWAIKIALVIFYKHVAAPGTKLQIIYNVALGVLGSTYLVIFFHIIFQCYPHDKRWSQDPLYQCNAKDAEINYWITVIMNIGTDIITLSLPISMVLQLQMKTKQKIGVCAIFALGFLVVIASIVRAYFSKRNETMLTCTVSMIETAVAIIATSLPPLRSLIMGHFSSAASGPNYNHYAGHYELSSAGNKNSRKRTQGSRTTNVVGGTQNQRNDSEDELFNDANGRKTPSVNVSDCNNKNGITVSTTFQIKDTRDEESALETSQSRYISHFP